MNIFHQTNVIVSIYNSIHCFNVLSSFLLTTHNNKTKVKNSITHQSLLVVVFLIALLLEILPGGFAQASPPRQLLNAPVNIPTCTAPVQVIPMDLDDDGDDDIAVRCEMVEKWKGDIVGSHLENIQAKGGYQLSIINNEGLNYDLWLDLQHVVESLSDNYTHNSSSHSSKILSKYLDNSSVFVNNSNSLTTNLLQVFKEKEAGEYLPNSDQVPEINVTRLLNSNEKGPTPGIFKFTRTGGADNKLVVAYELTGDAKQDIDYKVLDPEINFEPGSSSSFMGIMPFNDTSEEGIELIQIKLLSSSEYIIGDDNQSKIELTDEFYPGFNGVVNKTDDLSINYDLKPDILALNAEIQSGFLRIVVGIEPDSWGNKLFSIFLDTDQNPDTGDQRPGYFKDVQGLNYQAGLFKGAEYRIEVRISPTPSENLAFYTLYQLPSGTSGNEIKFPNNSQNITYNYNSVLIEVPTTVLVNIQTLY